MIFAVRKPLEVKGVYTAEEKVIELRKKYPGLSVRTFEDNQQTEAFKWAKVNGVADAKQQVVKTNMNKSKPIKCDMENVLDLFLKENCRIAEIKLIDETVIWLTLADMYYLKAYEERNFFNQVWNAETRNFQDTISKNQFERLKHNIGKLSKSNITFMNDGVMIRNWGEPEHKDSKYHLPGGLIYIPFNSILKIKPSGYWTLGNKIIKNNDLLNLCKKEI